MLSKSRLQEINAANALTSRQKLPRQRDKHSLRQLLAVDLNHTLHSFILEDLAHAQRLSRSRETRQHQGSRRAAADMRSDGSNLIVPADQLSELRLAQTQLGLGECLDVGAVDMLESLWKYEMAYIVYYFLKYTRYTLIIKRREKSKTI